MIAFVMVGSYLAATLVVGYLARQRRETSAQFLHARGRLPSVVTSLAFLAANCGALEIVGLVATSAKYGALALHFYWLGAIPAMLFLALFMMPVYMRSGAMTVPDFLRVRFGPATHILSAAFLAAMMAFVAGIGLYAISWVLHVFLGAGFFSIAVAATAVVLCYVLVGGLQATIYNEVLQLALVIAGLIPLSWAVLHDFHGLEGLRQRLPPGMVHLWISQPLVQPHSTMDDLGLVAGLGFILGCGYWCTDFLLIQRALAARSAAGPINTPLFAAVPKMFFPILVVVPGLAAAVLLRGSGITRYDQALPFLMRHYYGRTLLGLGIAAVLASLMSGLAGNINALSTVWTHDLYRQYLRRGRSDAHYLRVGRLTAVAASVLSLLTAWICFRYNDLMDYLQLLFSLFNAPLFAIFLLGMFTTWATPAAGFWGLLGGLLVAAIHHLAVALGLIHYGSQMLADFYGAIYGWSGGLLVAVVVSRFTPARPIEELKGITWSTQQGSRVRVPGLSWVLAGFVLTACAALNYIFR
ncbi:MAG TPA: sodium/solute symporter [Acidobacteriaceae bacterium]|nr:sodium/solute symporter [Acidobacteriaceae bacterium]